jgi:predicted nucleic acid-binding protein
LNHALCVDASVAVKWVVPEQDSEVALSPLDHAITSGTDLVGPPHLKAEVTSALYRRLRSGEMDEELAIGQANRFEEFPISLVAPSGLVAKAIVLSLEFGLKHPYDAFYLGLGELLDCEVWTADFDFHTHAGQAYPRLRLLADFAS